MKKLIALLLALCLTLSAAAALADSLDDILAKGSITIASEGCWAPWTYEDENGLTGFDIEVGLRIAEKLGVEADLVACDWDGLFAGLSSGRFDLVINGVDITDERRETFDFSDPYVSEHMVVIVRSDNDDIHSFEDLNGKTTANTLASSYSITAESYGATPMGVDDLNQTLELVMTGRIDATLNDESAYSAYMAEYPDAPLKIAARSEEGALKGIPVPKGEDSARLLAVINEVIAEMIESGEMEELSVKYFGSYNPIQ